MRGLQGCATIACQRERTPMTSETPAAQSKKRGHVDANAAKERLAIVTPHLGIACPLAWAFWINTQASGPIDQLPWCASYALLAIAMVVFGLVAKRFKGFLASRQAAVVVAVIGACSAFLLGAGHLFIPGPAAIHAGIVVCSCCLGWLYLQWAPSYAAIDIKRCIIALFGANVVACFIKMLMHFIHPAASLVLAMLLPALSIICARRCAHEALSQENGASPQGSKNSQAQGQWRSETGAAMRFTPENIRGLWKVAAAISAFSVVTALLLGAFTGNQGSVDTAEFLLSRLMEMAISAIIIFYVFALKRSFNFPQLWRLILLVLAVDILFVMVLPSVTLLRCIESCVWDLLVLCTWLTLADIAHHSSYKPYLVFGLGWPFYTLAFAIGSLAAQMMPNAVQQAPFMAFLMFVLLVVSAFCLELRDQDTRWIFFDLGDTPAVPIKEFKSIDERCEAVAKEHGLTTRELEVMQLLCKGRTKAYIAETLFLSENTIKSHSKTLYTKLSIHSKRELLDKVGIE